LAKAEKVDVIMESLNEDDETKSVDTEALEYDNEKT